MNWNDLLSKLDKFSESGWRKLFFWSAVMAMAVALPYSYVIQPALGQYAPVDFLDRLNGTLTIVAGLAGLRAVEKHAQRTQEK